MTRTKPEPFDPYHKWLGISPQDQPPHYYRLLGVELFEADSDVISNAADGRMAQVKNFQAGKHSAVSQRILNEIATAKVCLLNAKKKAEYDRQLRGLLESPQNTASAMARVSPPFASAVENDPLTGAGITDFGFSMTSGPSSTSLRGKKKRKSFPWPIAAAVAGAVVILGGVLIYVVTAGNGKTTSRGKSPSEDTPTNAPASSQRPDPPKITTARVPTIVREPSPEDTSKPEPIPPVKATEEKSPAQSKPEPEDPFDPPVKPDDPQAKSATEEKPQKPAAPKKHAVPDDEKRLEIEKQAREAFPKEYASKTPIGRLDLAGKLDRLGKETRDDPASRFVLLRLAAEEFAAGGEVAKALEVLDQIAEQYEADAVRMKIESLGKAISSLRGPAFAACAPAALSAAQALEDVALRNYDFDSALEFARLSSLAGHKLPDRKLAAELDKHVNELRGMKGSFDKIQNALKKDPADGKAALAAGQFYCYTMGDWDKGLPWLAKGSAPDLAALASQDLSGPTDPKEQVRVGDAWRSLAKKGSPARSHILDRALHWYSQALPKLSPLEQEPVKKRIAEIPQDSVAPTAKTGGVIEPGNIALATNGTKVVGVKYRPEKLIDGDLRPQEPAVSPIKSEWTIILSKVYRLQEIRWLPQGNPPDYVYRYQILVSKDGTHFELLEDRSKQDSGGWQVIPLKPQPVKAIKLLGLYSNVGSNFCGVEFEAYCIPPGPSAKK